jgi:hypothetical protein
MDATQTKPKKLAAFLSYRVATTSSGVAVAHPPRGQVPREIHGLVGELARAVATGFPGKIASRGLSGVPFPSETCGDRPSASRATTRTTLLPTSSLVRRSRSTSTPPDETAPVDRV